MKTFMTPRFLLILTMLGLLMPGCATRNVNPPQARAHTGYADFYAEPAGDLCWEVARFDEHAQAYKRLFSRLEPPQGGVLRLALAPGHHRLRVTFLNCVISKPAEVEVEVIDGKITPVRVTLTEAGTRSVRTQTDTRGRTEYGPYGRRTKISSEEAVLYDISAVAAPSVAYEVKEQMPYARR